MARPIKPHWHASRRVWLTALGERYEDASGRVRRRQVVLCDEHGYPIGQHDEAGKLAALSRLRAQCEAEEAGATDPELAVVLRAWIDWHAERGTPARSDRSRRDRARTIANLRLPGGKLLGDVTIHDLRHEHYHAIRRHGERQGWSSGTIRGYCSDFLACLRWAARSIYSRDPHVLLRHNPFPPGSVELPPPGRSSRPCPTWEELLTILDRLDVYVERPNRGLRARKAREAARTLALAVRVIAERGCRPSEVYGLRVEQWDDGLGGFDLGKHKTAHHGVVGVLPLRSGTADRVRALIARPDRIGPWVFGPLRTEGQGPPDLQSLRAWWARHRDEVGAAGYELYSFRNTVSNHLRMQGVHGRALQLVLRQGSEVADAVYRRDTLAEARRVLEGAGLG